MSQQVSLLNGTNLNRDKDFTTLAKDILNNSQGIITGLQVTSGQVSTGRCFIKCTRTSITPNEDVIVLFENNATVTIDTTGTKKVYILIDQAKINDWSANPLDGTTIGVITTWASYPAGNYIALASITGGVITDDRPFIKFKPIKRYGLTPYKLIYTDVNGEEQYISLDTIGKVLTAQWVTSAPVFQAPGWLDIAWLTEETSTIGALDMFVIYQNGVGNKKHLAQASTSNEWILELWTDAEFYLWTDIQRVPNLKQASQRHDLGITNISASWGWAAAVYTTVVQFIAWGHLWATLSWSYTAGSLGSCTIALQYSPDNSTWTTITSITSSDSARSVSLQLPYMIRAGYYIRGSVQWDGTYHLWSWSISINYQNRI